MKPCFHAKGLTRQAKSGNLLSPMKKSLLAFAVAAAATFIALTGCETEKLSDSQLSITPSSATLAPGDTLVLTAQGGWDYTWDKPTHGTLSTYNGKKVTYTAPNSLGSDSSSTNELTEIIQVHSASNHTATATITIKGE